ncbi:hypothetical protein COO60DRAFT_1646459 [Scenedesmus sp. NREL 46B-D3]|nr:hypothetical protein COO60DRAFT_1646459 [Scenedesmus sp. NREL 46B-D3]
MRPPPSRHERNCANLRFQQKRAAWRRQLKELRKQWWQEHRQRVGARKASADVAQQQVAQLRELRVASKQQDRAKHQLEREIRMAERAVEVAALRLSSAIRQDMRLQTIQKHKMARRHELLKESRTWIPPHTLEARIAAALDNPQSLGMAE